MHQITCELWTLLSNRRVPALRHMLIPSSTLIARAALQMKKPEGENTLWPVG
jgi:hypothetical protein